MVVVIVCGGILRISIYILPGPLTQMSVFKIMSMLFTLASGMHNNIHCIVIVFTFSGSLHINRYSIHSF